MKNFRTLNIAVDFYRIVSTLRIASHLKIQLDRAAASISLNLAEGAGRRTPKDQARFYIIAFGSLRECQAILSLSSKEDSAATKSADLLAANIYQLIKSRRGG